MCDFGKRTFAFALAVVLASAFHAGCAAREKEAPREAPPAASATQEGRASYYGADFHGQKTASGDRFNMHGLTAAHRTLAMGTRVRVTNLDNGKTVVVRITDRGPYAGKRVIDVSRAAARRLGMIEAGVVPVKLEVLR